MSENNGRVATCRIALTLGSNVKPGTLDYHLGQSLVRMKKVTTQPSRRGTVTAVTGESRLPQPSLPVYSDTVPQEGAPQTDDKSHIGQ